MDNATFIITTYSDGITEVEADDMYVEDGFLWIYKNSRLIAAFNKETVINVKNKELCKKIE